MAISYIVAGIVLYAIIGMIAILGLILLSAKLAHSLQFWMDECFWEKERVSELEANLEEANAYIQTLESLAYAEQEDCYPDEGYDNGWAMPPSSYRD